jgi:hypothetical protein
MNELENGDSLTCKIVEITYLVAIDKDGNEYEIMNFNEPVKGEEILYESIDGTFSIEETQDMYDDGSYARSYTERRFFKPNQI